MAMLWLHFCPLLNPFVGTAVTPFCPLLHLCWSWCGTITKNRVVGPEINLNLIYVNDKKKNKWKFYVWTIEIFTSIVSKVEGAWAMFYYRGPLDGDERPLKKTCKKTPIKTKAQKPTVPHHLLRQASLHDCWESQPAGLTRRQVPRCPGIARVHQGPQKPQPGRQIFAP